MKEKEDMERECVCVCVFVCLCVCIIYKVRPVFLMPDMGYSQRYLNITLFFHHTSSLSIFMYLQNGMLHVDEAFDPRFESIEDLVYYYQKTRPLTLRISGEEMDVMLNANCK